jgi:L-seryl-tRNA(Ser) seleniumtransferase
VSDARRDIPSVDRLLGSDAFAELVADAPRKLVLQAIQQVQDELRASLAAGAQAPATIAEPAWYAELTREALGRMRRRSLRPVINATGVVLHTNLGRAPLAESAREAVELAARGYSNLEYDIEQGRRGSRYDHCAKLLRQLTGAEAALVVNNNAAALVLVLNTLAHDRESVISRGELVEIGGAFRVPEIMARSGTRMVEIGSTNRTHPDDYASAISAATGVVLKVHRSNFRVSGFTAEVHPAELAALAHARNVPLVHDLGSGLLLPAATLGLPHEPTPAEALGAGADVVTMSGDKLLGGPQAGIILGRGTYVAEMKQNPLCRAVRVDKLTLAALEATLTLYLDPPRALREIPVLRMLTATAAELEQRARRFAARLSREAIACDVVSGAAAVGGGAFPDVELPGALVRIEYAGSAAELERRLRTADPHVIARILDDAVTLDLRTVLEDEEDALFAAVVHARAAHA